jgi:tetratricopeptide (TPR) repeat protein
VRALWFSVAAVLATSGVAHAGSKDIQYGPAPAWVAPSPPPTQAASPEGAALRIVYTDLQIRMTDAGDENYSAFRLKILTPEGLPAASVAATWNPSTDDMVIHRLRLIRGGQVIDVLADNKFEVIQRENNLENNMLDGELTAALQVPGVEVGDELEFAATLRRREAVFANRSHGFAQLPIVGTQGAHRVRLLWSGDKKLKWSGTSDLGQLAVTDRGGEHELDYEMKAPGGVVLTDGAPARFNIHRLIEYTEFGDWSEVAGLMAPLFDKAAQLAPDSPVRAEAARIAKANADPEARARAALQLVQDRIRYVYVGLDGGNYRPASADETWKRRFGDCKAKTVLLMALLRELGIQGEAVLVNSKGGDGADKRLPTPAMFDHVLVRTTINGKTYWLDGTRLGDRQLSATLQVPSRWALPIKPAAAKLEGVAQDARTLPRSSTVVDIDATAGTDKPAKVFIEEVNRSDEAPVMRGVLAGLSREDADRELKTYWRQGNPWLQPATVSWRYDDLQQAIVLTARGDGKMDWEGDAKDGRSLDVMGAGFTPPNEMRRPAEQDQQAPWAVEKFPSFSRWTTIIRLPPATAKKQWYLYDDPVDVKLGGVSYHREAELDGGVVRSTMSIRDYLPEITPAQAKEVNDKLPTFNNKISRVYEAAARAPTPSLAELEKAAGNDVRRLTGVGSAYYLKSQWADAERIYAKVLATEPSNFAVWVYRIESLENLGRYDDALKALDTGKFDGANALLAQYSRVDLLMHAKRKEEGLALIDKLMRDNPDKRDVQFAMGQVLRSNGELARALAVYTDYLTKDTDHSYPHLVRAETLDGLGRSNEALSDLNEAVRLAPEDSSAFAERGVVLAKLGRNQEALADLEEAWRINPMNAGVADTYADLLRKVGRGSEASAVFDAWIARDNSGRALNGRCWARALANVELATAEADCAKAVGLAPKAGNIWDSYALVALRDGRLPEAIKRYDKAIELSPKQATSLYGRGYAKIKAGDKAGGEADIAAAKAISPKAGQDLIDAGLTVN